MVEVEKMFI